MEILQSIEYTELRAQVQMQRGMPDGREINQHDIAMRLLQRDCGVDGSGGATGAAFGAEKSEDPSLAAAARGAGTAGAVTSESFEQRFRTGRVFEIFARAGA